MNPITDVLIWITIAVDLGNITEKNVNEFYWRLRFREMFLNYKTLNVTNKKGKVIRNFNPSLSDIRQHIGLQTNVSNKTRAQFLANMRFIMKEQLNEKLRDERKALTKATVQPLTFSSVQEEQLIGRFNRKSQTIKIINVTELNNSPNLRRIWTLSYFPFTMGGNVNRPIITEVPIIEEKEIGKGFKAFSFMTPKGTIRIAESITGAIVGDSFEQVMKDISAASLEVCKKQIEEAYATLAKGNSLFYSNGDFFRYYKY
jgi:hypothetical protein